MAVNQKFKKKLKFRLEKEDMEDFVSRVGFLCDASGSMKSHYSSGDMHLLNEMLFVVADKFDDNHEMDMAAFSNDAIELPGMVESNSNSYVEDNILNNRSRDMWGGTHFSSGISHFVDIWYGPEIVKKASFFGKMFGQKDETRIIPATSPSFLIVQTDGYLADETRTLSLLKEINQKYKMFITFLNIGITGTTFTRSAEKFDNVQNIFIPNFNLNEDIVYDDLISDKVSKFFHN